MAMTALQLTKLRQLTGGVRGTNEPDYLTDVQLDAEFADVADSFNATIIPVLRLRVGMAVVYINGSPEHGIEQNEARYKHLVERLAYYEKLFGETGTLLQTGTLETGIDREATDTDLLDWF